MYEEVCDSNNKIKQLSSGYKGDHKSIYIVPIGDIHFGNKYMNMKYLDDALKFVKKHRNRCRIFLMGDLLESATKTSVGRGVYDEAYNTHKQFEKAVEVFKPYADLIDVIIEGNHEERIIRDTSFEIMEEFAHRIGRHDAYAKFQGIVNVNVGELVYSADVWHGSTGGATETAAINALLKMRERVVCHLYLMGHTHKLIGYKRRVFLPAPDQPEPLELTQLFVNTGTSLDDGGYGVQKGLAVQSIGFGAIELFADERKMVFHRIENLI